MYTELFQFNMMHIFGFVNVFGQLQTVFSSTDKRYSVSGNNFNKIIKHLSDSCLQTF